MRSYWLKIGLGALGVFVVGMLLITVFRRVTASAHRIAESSDPVSLPVAFVPFSVDSERLGTIKRVKVIRSAPDKVSGFELVVAPKSSAVPGRVAECLLVLNTSDGFDPESGFRCASPEDTAGGDLAAFGTLHLLGDDSTYPILVPGAMVRDLAQHRSGEEPAESVPQHADSIAARAERMADSIAAAVHD